MTTSNVLRRAPLRIAAWTLALVATIALSGCTSTPGSGGSTPNGGNTGSTSGDQPNGTKKPSSTQATGSATVSVGGRKFTFDLRLCSIYTTGDVLLSGLGTEVGSDTPSHLDGDETGLGKDAQAEFRIDIGASGPFESSDVFISLGNTIGGSYSRAPDGAGHLITASSWDQNGNDLGTGTLHFTCD